MSRRTWFTVSMLLCGGSAAMAYEPPAGFAVAGEPFASSAFAFGPDGRIAVAADNAGGGASIRVYGGLPQVGSTPLLTLSDRSWKFIASLDFAGGQTLVIGENGDRDTLFAADVSTGAVQALAVDGSVSNLSDVTVREGWAYAVAANGPGANDLVRLPLSGGAPQLVIDNFGTGYAGGVVFDGAGNVLLTDSNDPAFTGAAGMVRRFDDSFLPLADIDLSAGGGRGAVDLVMDFEGDLLVSTGPTLTLVKMGEGVPEVSAFGTFGGAFPFPTFIDFHGAGFEPGSGSGLLLVGGFTDVPGSFAIAPVPEPGAAMILFMGGLFLRGRSRRGGVR